ncbi:hypothetical protein FIU94_11150 [Sulfitobacter sp. THAF37]|uniref:DUF1269 domain-containing protein n=1 Tax=Sulfitobacter sp. THAF37 TaxID=2587855 RepID=UPI001268541A|nr:DUF1269 domain-containing protein [Sulfitobacter sp. THAF37]QFT59381.1 hypothetical protein FIU94_11150 [Sulfitobacter sp. THAF37]
MSELIVIGYETPEKAEEARTDLMNMAREYLVDVADAVVAVADMDGNVKLNQMVNMWTAGAAGGAFWGLLVGMIFFNPLLGVAVGAGAGALSGALTDYGINDDFMKQVGEVLKPGQAALFMMVRANASDRVIERLGEHGGRVLRTNLDRDAENHLRRAFDDAHKAEVGAKAPEQA